MEELEDAVAQHRLNRRMGKSTRTGGAYNVSDALLKRKLKEKREAARGRGPTTKYPKTPKKGGARVRGYSTQQAKIAEEKNVAAHKAMTSSKQRQVPVEDHLRSVIAKKVTGTSGVYGPKTKDGKRPTRSYIKIMPNNESVDSSEFGKFHTRANQGFGATGGLREPDTGSYPFREVDDLLDGGGKSRAKTDRSDAPNPKTVARGKKKVRHQVVIDKDGKVKRRPDTGSVVYTQDASKERTVKGVQTPKHTAAVRLNDGSLDPKAYVDKPGPNRDDKQKRLAEQRAKDNYLKYKEIQESRGKKVKPYSGRETSQPRWIAELRQRRQLKEAMVRGLGAKGKRKPIKSAGRKVSNHVVVNPDGSLGPPRERSYNAAVAGRAEKANAGISSQLQTSKPGSPKAADKKALARALAGKSPKGVVSRRSGTKKPNTNAYINPRGVQGPPRESTARKKALARALSQARRDSNVSKKIAGEKAAEAANQQEVLNGITPLDDDNFPKTSQQEYPSTELEGRETKRYKPGTKARLSDYKPSKNSDSPMVDDEVVKEHLARKRAGKSKAPVRSYPSAKDNDTVKVGQRVGKRNPAKVTKVKDGIATVKTVDADGKVIRGKKGKTARIPTTKLDYYRDADGKPMAYQDMTKAQDAEYFSKDFKRRLKGSGGALGAAALPLAAYGIYAGRGKAEKGVAAADTAAMLGSMTKYGRWALKGGGLPLTAALLGAEGVIAANKRHQAYAELRNTKEAKAYGRVQAAERRKNHRRFAKGKAPRYRMPKFGEDTPTTRAASAYFKKRDEVMAKPRKVKRIKRR
jgi:hypothetical protein